MSIVELSNKALAGVGKAKDCSVAESTWKRACARGTFLSSALSEPDIG